MNSEYYHMDRETVFSSIPDMEEEEVERNEYSKGILRRGHLYFTSYRWGGQSMAHFNREGGRGMTKI